MKVFALLLITALSGCIVAPASGDAAAISSYNTQILTFWGVVLTGLVTIVTNLIGIWMNRNAAKKSQLAEEKSKEAIVAANHQNEKLMRLTEGLIATDKKSEATDQRVDDLTDSALSREQRGAVRPASVTGQQAMKTSDVKIDATGASISIVEGKPKGEPDVSK